MKNAENNAKKECKKKTKNEETWKKQPQNKTLRSRDLRRFVHKLCFHVYAYIRCAKKIQLGFFSRSFGETRKTFFTPFLKNLLAGTTIPGSAALPRASWLEKGAGPPLPCPLSSNWFKVPLSKYQSSTSHNLPPPQEEWKPGYDFHAPLSNSHGDSRRVVFLSGW